MSAKVNHIAIASDHYAIKYALLRSPVRHEGVKQARSMVVGDGYVGLNSIPRRDGRCSGIDHFGIEVDDLEDTIARIRKFLHWRR